jgi:hypothetical protein
MIRGSSNGNVENATYMGRVECFQKSCALLSKLPQGGQGALKVCRGLDGARQEAPTQRGVGNDANAELPQGWDELILHRTTSEQPDDMIRAEP